MVAEVMSGHGLSQRRACGLIGITRRSLRRVPAVDRNLALRQRLRILAEERRRWGSPMLYLVLRREGFAVNHKRVERLYRDEGLSLRRRRRRKSRKTKFRKTKPRKTRSRKTESRKTKSRKIKSRKIRARFPRSKSKRRARSRRQEPKNPAADCRRPPRRRRPERVRRPGRRPERARRPASRWRGFP